MPCVTTIAEACARLTNAVEALLTAQLDDEIDATNGALAIDLEHPAAIVRGYYPGVAGEVPEVIIHLGMGSRVEQFDAMGNDTMQHRLSILVTLAEMGSGTDGEMSSYADAMSSYVHTIAGLVIRQLPLAAANIGVFKVDYQSWTWDPRVGHGVDVMLSARLDLMVYQTVCYDRPTPPPPPP